jgi:hypothetical protein
MGSFTTLTTQLMDHCLVYFSFSVNPFSTEDIDNILEKSRRNNAECGITGLLLYMNGSVMQVLEGDEKAVDHLFERIKQDNRHQDVTQVFSRPILSRLFANWSMGYETVTAQELENIKHIVELYT